MKPGRSNGLDRIGVPNDYAVLHDGEEAPRIPLVTKKEDMEDVLLPRDPLRYWQKKGKTRIELHLQGCESTVGWVLR
jgi:hypothetical protein